MSLRIVQVISGETWSGGQQQILHLSRGLRDRGHDVLLVCQEGSVLSGKAGEAGLETAVSGMYHAVDLKLIRILRHRLAGRGADLIDVHRPKPLFAAITAKVLNGRPALVATRRVSFPISSRLSARFKYDLFLDGLVAVSGVVRRSLVDSGVPSGKIKTIYGSVDTDRFKPGVDRETVRRELSIPSDIPLVVIIANVSEWKGQAWFISLMPRIISRLGQVRLVLAGLETDGEAVAGVIGESGLEGSVTGVGFRDDVESFLAAADLLVCPSREGEGLAGAVREAMAMRVPVVSTSAGGNAEVVLPGKTGYLVPPGDGEAMMEAVVRALTNREESRRLADEAFRLIGERFTVARMVDETESYYRELVSRRRGKRGAR